MKMEISNYTQVFSNDDRMIFPNNHKLPKKNAVPFSGVDQFLKHPSYYLPLRIFVILLGVSFLFLGLTFRKLPPVVPLYYSLPWGEEQLVRPYELFIIPVSFIIMFLANIILSFFIIKKDTFLIQMLLWASCILALSGLITLIKIILLVI